MKTYTLLLFLFIQGILFGQLAPIRVSVTDFGKKPLQGEQLLFVEKSSKETFLGISDKGGIFELQLPKGHYEIQLKSVGDAQDYSEIEIPALPPNATYQEMWMEVMISQPKFFTLDNLNFTSGSATILKSSYSELKELLEYLKLKPDTSVEIAGHTDSDGDENNNMVLSQNRADAVVNYLVKNGISKTRLTAKGYGETQPIADNSSNDGKSQNRRTEVRMN